MLKPVGKITSTSLPHNRCSMATRCSLFRTRCHDHQRLNNPFMVVKCQYIAVINQFQYFNKSEFCVLWRTHNSKTHIFWAGGISLACIYPSPPRLAPPPNPPNTARLRRLQSNKRCYQMSHKFFIISTWDFFKTKHQIQLHQQ